MSELKIDISDLLEYVKQTEDAERIAEREATRTMDASLAAFEEQVVTRTPINIGILRGATATEVFRGRGLNMRGEVVNPTPYGEPVEYGRKAGKMPPVAAIQIWVQRKKIKFTYKRGKRDVVMTPQQTAFVIARAIGKRGTKGAFMFKQGFEAAKPHVERAWETLLDRIVRELTK